MPSPVFLRGRRRLYFRDHYYPSEALTVSEHIQSALLNTKHTQDTRSKVVIVPNGAYRICKEIMAEAYAQLCPDTIKRIFVFGKTMQYFPYKCGLSNTDYLDCPLGKMEIDKKVNADLLQFGDFRYLDLLFEEKERSIEMQLPFIAKLMENYEGEYTVVPIYIGDLSFEQQRVIAKRFITYLHDPSNVFIFSASLCHWGDIYGKSAELPEIPSVLDTIKEYDRRAIDALSELKFKPFDEFLLDNKVPVPDYLVFTICLRMVRQMLDTDLYSISKLSEDACNAAYHSTATFRLMGQAWTYPDVTKEDSCISYVSAVIDFDKEKHIPEEPALDNPLDKIQ